MNTDKPNTEHFCTLFDHHFLPMGMALYRSLAVHAGAFHLWIVCMDETVERQLRWLGLSGVSLIPIREIEERHARLAEIKSRRNTAEFCWTVTPFTFQEVFKREPFARRVTYLDADVFFFDDPKILLREMETAAKDVLITEHAYAPEYDETVRYGRFCVQFLTVSRTDAARQIIDRWQGQCLDWCGAVPDKGRFGDQKYLDDWPERFPHAVHIVRQTAKTLAPWNVRHLTRSCPAPRPVLYHFHRLRILGPSKVMLYLDYVVGKNAAPFYRAYSDQLRDCLAVMRSNSWPVPCMPFPEETWKRIKFLKRFLFREIEFGRL
jgi:hypothetical protein